MLSQVATATSMAKARHKKWKELKKWWRRGRWRRKRRRRRGRRWISRTECGAPFLFLLTYAEVEEKKKKREKDERKPTTKGRPFFPSLEGQGAPSTAAVFFFSLFSLSLSLRLLIGRWAGSNRYLSAWVKCLRSHIVTAPDRWSTHSTLPFASSSSSSSSSSFVFVFLCLFLFDFALVSAALQVCWAHKNDVVDGVSRR